MQALPTSPTAAFIMLSALLSAASGCASHDARPVASPPSRFVQNPALTLPASQLVAAADIDEAWGLLSGGWETGRNDFTLGYPGSPIITEYGVAEIRHYEFLRTVNGRPRNDAWTRSRSFQRLFGP